MHLIATVSSLENETNARQLAGWLLGLHFQSHAVTADGRGIEFKLELPPRPQSFAISKQNRITKTHISLVRSVALARPID